MKVQLVSFGQIEVEGKRYDHDVVIEQALVRKGPGPLVAS
jgi:hypothetical protein